MAMFAYLNNTPEVAVLCYWNNALEVFKSLNPYLLKKTELILAAGCNHHTYNNAEPLMKELGFVKGKDQYINPNTGNKISFWAASPKTVPHSISSHSVPFEKALADFPACCGLGQVIGLTNLSGITHDPRAKRWAQKKIGLISVIDNGNEQEEKAYAEHGFSPVFFLSAKTIWYRHNSEVVPS